MADDINRPDGLAFSPDEKTLYIIEDGSTPPVIRAYDVVGDGTGWPTAALSCRMEEAPATAYASTSTAICGAAGPAAKAIDGVMVFNSAGAPIGRIDLPERCANVCFGGYRRSRLFMVASRSLYALWVGTSGAAGG